MRKPDDSSLTPNQYAAVRREAERALHASDAFGRYPTPVADVMAAAKVTEAPDDIFELGFLTRMREKAGSALRKAAGKVIGLLDARERLIFIDATLSASKKMFVRLHETAHAVLEWQRSLYVVVEDSQETLSPDTAELFDREANVFASEVLFQLDSFTQEAENHQFGIKVPLTLSKKYGASVYSTVRRYVSTSSSACCVVVLDPPELRDGDGFRCNVRRVIASEAFRQEVGDLRLPEFVTPDHPVGAIVPVGSRRMSRPRTLQVDSGTTHHCIAEAFRHRYQVFILIHLPK